jgi:hypothetical protein
MAHRATYIKMHNRLRNCPSVSVYTLGVNQFYQFGQTSNRFQGRQIAIDCIFAAQALPKVYFHMQMQMLKPDNNTDQL